MTYRWNLPIPHPGDAAWDDVPPDPLNAPALYQGLLWRRVAGYMIDVALIAMLSAALWFVAGVAGALSFGLLTPLGILALAILPVAYHTYFVGHAGATPGMALFDVEIRAWTGHRPDYGQAFLATVVFYTSVSLTAWLVLIVALFNDRRRTLHDFLAGTLAVRRSHLESGAPPVLDGFD